MPAPDPGSPDEQLAAIAAVGEALGGRELDHWLFGGWAVDFWVGRVTRPHDDVDVAAWIQDRDVIDEVLLGSGWRRTDEVDDPGCAASYRWGPVLLELTFVQPDDRNRIIIPMSWGHAVWSPEPFGDDRRTLRGVRSRTIPLRLLRAGKAVPREPADEAAKDRADAVALEGIDTPAT